MQQKSYTKNQQRWHLELKAYYGAGYGAEQFTTAEAASWWRVSKSCARYRLRALGVNEVVDEQKQWYYTLKHMEYDTDVILAVLNG